MATYKVTSILGSIDASVCPHPIVGIIFPGVEFKECSVSPSEITVTFDTPQTPADLGPLVRVELISTE
jgi:hypothetical protein